jgi:phage gp36-like protein
MYATKSDLEKHSSAAAIVQLTDRADPPAGVADDAVIDQAIESASSLIDGYLRGRYGVPLSAPPAEIRDCCVVLAYKELHTGGIYPDGVQKDYDAKIKWLTAVSSGVVKLSVDAAPTETTESDSAEYAGPERTFDRCSLRNF